MTNKYLCICIAFIIGLQTANAATTGKIQGTVHDAQTGELLPGANVTIDGLQRGAFTDVNGDYTILLVEPGVYAITASMVGYDAQRKTGARVQSDFTTTLDFAIRETALELGEIVVIAERPPIEPDKTTSQYMLSAEDLEAVPIVRDMKDFVELQAGVSINADGSDIMIRGGNREDVAYMVDGVRISTTDHRGTREGLGRTLNKTAVQELQVITGGYNAEYGNAQGGVISLVTRDGSANFSGLFDYRITPPGQKHWGANAYDSKIHRGNNPWNNAEWVAQSIEIPADLNGDGVNDVIAAHRRRDYTGVIGHRIEANLSGPLAQNLTFFMSSQWRRTPAAFPEANPATPFNTSNTGKLAYAASSSLKLRTGGVYDRRRATFGGPATGGKLDMRDNGRNLFLYVPDPTGNLIDTDAMYYLGITHALSPKTFYEVRLSYSTTHRDTTDMHPHDVVSDNLTSDRTTDGTYTIYRETVNWNRWAYKRISLKTDLSSQVNKQNFVKTGFEMIRYNNWHQEYWSDGPTHRRLRWFSKDYTASAFWPSQENQGLNPIDLGIYLQDKIEFEGMIVNAGVRGDLFFQNTEVKDIDGFYGQKSPWAGMTRALIVPTVKGPTIKSFQPRLGVSHPITDKSLVRYFYGKFTQRPQFHQLFQNEFISTEAKDKDLNKNGVIDPAEQHNDFNDPSSQNATRFLPPEETTSFEVGFDWNFVGDYVLGLTTYYKATSNRIGPAAQEWRDPETPQYVTGVQAFAPGAWQDVRGFEINLRKKFSHMFSFNVGYNLQWADGGDNGSSRRDVWPDSLFVANGYYWVDWDIDPATGAEIPVSLTEKARRENRSDPAYYIKLFGASANAQIQAQQRAVETTARSWAWIPWYSHYAAEGVQVWQDRKDTSQYGDDDTAFWEKVSAYPGNPGSGEANLLVGHNQQASERAPISADRRSFGSITLLFATPAQYGPLKGRALSNLRANLVYRLYTGAAFGYTANGIQGVRYGPIHTRMDFNAEKVFGNPSGLNLVLSIEVDNLFNQKDHRQNSTNGIPIDFNTDRYQQWGITGLDPTNDDIQAFDLKEPEINDLGNYWDSPRQVSFGVQIKW